MYEEEFQRFKNGHVYTIRFDGEATIESAHIYVDELARDLDVTAFVKDDKYWIQRVEEKLFELRATAQERKYWNQSKVSGE